jgi:hypothetical protein
MSSHAKTFTHEQRGSDGKKRKRERGRGENGGK